MSLNYDHSNNRQLLTFTTVVKPTNTISYFTLINSLISLCATISSYNPCNTIFTSNKQNSKNALRFITLLQLFLQEIKGNNLKGRLVISPLLDLHVALQELVCLFEDLTRPDARAWVLMRQETVTGRFRAVFGSVVGSVERLPESVVCECDEEVRECVGLLTRQVKRVGFRVESGDLRAFNMVRFLLGRVESRVIPDPSELRWVMDYLCVKSWVECDKQVRFLESGNGLTESGLLGLMMYCRGVLFNQIDYDNINVKKIDRKKFSSVIGTGLNLDDFKCPISLEIMVDPVVISTGHTYDRTSIIKWFKSGKPVCPKTGQRVKCVDMIPNVTLQNVTKQYCLENGVFLMTLKNKGSTQNSCDNSVGNLAYEGAIKMLGDFLLIKLAFGTNEEKSRGVHEIRLVTKRSVFIRESFVKCGVIPYLLNLILVKDSIIQENSIAALLNLSKNSEGKSVIVNNWGLGLVVEVLRNGIKIEARQHAGAILFYLSSVEEYRRLIGNHPDAILSLVELIRVGGDQGKKNALVAVFSLLKISSSHCKVLEGRLVPILVTLLDSTENEDLIVNSLAILSTLAEKRDGAKAILGGVRALDAILKVLCSSSSDSSRLRGEHCVSLLLAMCIQCEREVLEVLVKNTSLTRALYSLLIDGTSKACKKANSLIRMIHEYSERSSTPSMPSHALPHETFIHVW